METTPDKHCKWQVRADYLEDALHQIHKHGSTVVAIMPHELESTVSIITRFEVISYIIIHYNPPTTVIPGLGGGDPDSATIQ